MGGGVHHTFRLRAPPGTRTTRVYRWCSHFAPGAISPFRRRLKSLRRLPRWRTSPSVSYANGRWTAAMRCSRTGRARCELSSRRSILTVATKTNDHPYCRSIVDPQYRLVAVWRVPGNVRARRRCRRQILGNGSSCGRSTARPRVWASCSIGRCAQSEQAGVDHGDRRTLGLTQFRSVSGVTT